MSSLKYKIHLYQCDQKGSVSGHTMWTLFSQMTQSDLNKE